MDSKVSGGVAVDTDYPGGNARVHSVGDPIRLSPDQRDSTSAWFYWNVEIRAGEAGRRRIDFGDQEVVGPRGPAVHGPDGWSWLGADARHDATAFSYQFDAGESVRFAFSLPYQVADFESTYRTYASNGRLRRETLTTSECGRSVPVLRVGSGRRDVVVACRHHACESTASYVFDGFLRALLESAPLPSNYTVHLLPFVDIDGVERGDQGKHRAPHDHNRDYVESNAISGSLSPLYAATAAVMTYVRGLEGALALGLDLHCPSKWGGDNDRPFFVADPETTSAAMERLTAALAAASGGSASALTYDDAPGTGIHEFDGTADAAPTFRSFLDRSGADLAATLEVPYVGTDDDPVTTSSTRAFGRALASAVGEWCRGGESGFS